MGMIKNLFLLVILPLSFAASSQNYMGGLSPEFHNSRRQALRNLMSENSVAVFFANPERNRADDVEFVYHQDPDFYYLTGYTEPHSALLIFSENQWNEDGSEYNEILFVRDNNPVSEMWSGKRLGVQDARVILGLDEVRSNEEFKDYKINFRSFDKVYYYNFKGDVRNNGGREKDLYDLIEEFRGKAEIPEDYSPMLQLVHGAMQDATLDLTERKEKVYSLTRRNPRLLERPEVSSFMSAGSIEQAMNVLSALPESNLDLASLARMMAQLRQQKTAEELAAMRRAVSVSCIGQIEVMKAMTPEMSELEIRGIHEFVFRKYGCHTEGYPSIIGSGANGCILHYIDNNRERLADDLVLMDVGAEYLGYTADVTRTIPADGTFSEEQRSIYNLVLQAQNAAFEQCMPGNQFHEPHLAARAVIDQGLAELGIIEKGQRHHYFPHSTSHYLGLVVHDPGTNGPLVPGQIITVEPGIYIPPGSPCHEKWWGIAVRIEDDILITGTGFENLSAAAPRTIEEIEWMMRQASALDDFILPDIDD